MIAFLENISVQGRRKSKNAVDNIKSAASNCILNLIHQKYISKVMRLSTGILQTINAFLNC